MAMFEIVQCEVVYSAIIEVSGTELRGIPQCLGEFEYKTDAERFLAEYGLTRDSVWPGRWHAPYTVGYVSRTLKEIKKEVKMRQHEWMPTRVGHGDKQCRWCLMTLAEATVLGFGCKNAPVEVTPEECHRFANMVRSLYNVDLAYLPELSNQDWKEFCEDPPRYFINRADKIQLEAICREVWRRQD